MHYNMNYLLYPSSEVPHAVTVAHNLLKDDNAKSYLVVH